MLRMSSGAAVTIAAEALCQRVAAQHVGFIFQTDKRSAQLAQHGYLLDFLRPNKAAEVFTAV